MPVAIDRFCLWRVSSPVVTGNSLGQAERDLVAVVGF